eukprot:TRINITY_DN7561_c0_g1_i3.p1 TRINITY_DN7561_c0_g1~~TRINITY_DN7561_c0_g1_i3.p1  ORF type:complete len:465 (+),score=99.68 TRINITY_DN7561_c0_g1_i3:55-1449(+)
MRFFTRGASCPPVSQGVQRILENIRTESYDASYGGLSAAKIPTQLSVIITYLEFIAIRTSGMYLTQPREEHVTTLQRKIDRDSDHIARIIIAAKDPNLIGALLLRQLKSLQQDGKPIIHPVSLDLWNEACLATERDTIAVRFQKCFEELHPISKTLLCRICRLLKAIHSEVETTNASASLLCRIFVPVMFPQDRVELRESCDGLEKCILFQGYIFNAIKSVQTSPLPARPDLALGSIKRTKSSVGTTWRCSIGSGIGSEMSQELSRSLPGSMKMTSSSSSTNAPKSDPLFEKQKESLFLQYQIFCIEKRAQIESSAAKKIDEIHREKVREYEEIKTQLSYFDDETEDEMQERLEREILHEMNFAAEIEQENGELMRVVGSLESELSVIQNDIQSLGSDSSSQHLDLHQMQERWKETNRENYHLFVQITSIVEEIDAMRASLGLPSLQHDEFVRLDELLSKPMSL